MSRANLAPHLEPKVTLETKAIPVRKNKSSLWISLAIAAAALLPLALNNYQIHILNLVVLYMILAIGLDLTIGYCGQLNLAHAAFYAVGAYTSAILTTMYEFSFWTALPFSMAISVFFGILIGLPSLKVRSHYLAIATLGLSIAVNEAIVNLEYFTGGPVGISGIPKPSFFGIALNNEFKYYYLVLGIGVVLFLFARLLVNHGIGRSFRAVRDDHVAAQSLGINIAKQQILAFALSGLFAGIGGSLYAHMLAYVSPDTFHFGEMMFMLTIVVIGGMGNIYGSITGALILIVSREWLHQFENWQQVLYGTMIVILVVFMPGGLVSVKSLFQKRRKSKLHTVK
ncbi:branched-chain amino acid ABC transporter permease [Ammoniphilus sp. 3BR4]|uniref:branched-chain amino acid ABC transporter permease n=1 Tax=Ammoniphilus sp. 3BR4 TaxID=3158265 RepID=UPI0034665B26